MTSPTNTALEAGAEFEGLLFSTATLPYSFMTALKIDPPLTSAALSVEIGYYERVQTTKHQQYLNTVTIISSEARNIVNLEQYGK